MKSFRSFFSRFPDALPLLALTVLALLYWHRILFFGEVLLPGDFLRGFAPFGSDPQAPWNILQWDALGQYYPWRFFAAQQLHQGLIPLWNPHQFSGTPFLANGQSAVFYPLGLPFWFFDTARAFGISALLHTMLAGGGTYFLVRRWQLSRESSLLAATAFAFCGYLAAWIVLPTLANTASWLPLLLLFFERSCEYSRREEARQNDAASTRAVRHRRNFAWFSLALASCFLAGHPQIFFYVCAALFLRALTLSPLLRAVRVLTGGAVCALALGALQLLPFLELARIGHRAGTVASAAGWQAIAVRALGSDAIFSLFLPYWPALSFDENKGYAGLAVTVLAISGLALGVRRALHRRAASHTQRTDAGTSQNACASTRTFIFSALLLICGLLYAMATPLSQLFYFLVPGFSQTGGVGRALVLWNLGAALLAAFALDALQNHARFAFFTLLALVVVAAELFAGTWNLHPTSSRASVYPRTQVTDFLHRETRDGARVLLLTPRETWLPGEGFRAPRTHPDGVLMANGATVYGLYDVSGYDSLALKNYRAFVAEGEEKGEVSPPLNGNILLLNNPLSQQLDALNVRFVVSERELDPQVGAEVLRAEGCIVYRRQVLASARGTQKSGADFAPGWRDGVYQPQSYRFGLFVSLCAVAFMAALLCSSRRAPLRVLAWRDKGGV